jgi:aminopeptidase N
MHIRPTFLALCALILVPSAAEAQRHWFADGAVPSRYEIAITPDIAAGTFSGEARIVVQAEAALEAVALNALDLTVARASIDGASARFESDAAAQTLTLTPHRPLRPGRHVIVVTYAGKIQDDAYGLFRVSYQSNGQTKRALATQFEPGDARRLAPMWDQPNRRAVFSVTVTAASELLAVSNMPVARAAPAGAGLTRTTFADTPSMASYLLFLAVGDFERVTRVVDGVELGVVVRRGEGHRTAAALQAGEDSLRYFTEYFAIPYPLPKLDMIGVPGAGGFGAMENWGAILYFDQFLLVDENSSEGERQRMFGIVAHEIAHQWFGNLVTMNWWDDLWLNEGFASWMAAKATERVHPDWDPWLSELAGGTQGAMALDARAGTHPIVQTVNTIEEANLAFDTITYRKGQAVLRMIEAYVGEDDFRAGVRAYLHAHAYGNARTEDLWAAVQAASGQPVLDIARSFTGQQGFPVLTAAVTVDGDITLAQRRFAMDDVSRTSERWSIPLVARRIDGNPMRVVMAPSADRILELSGSGPYLVNAGQTAFFRVRYDERNFTQLTARFNELGAADQLGLLLDYWAFGRSGDAPFTNYLELVSAVRADADPLIASDTVGSMLALADYAKQRPSRDMVNAYARRALRPFFDRVGWEARTGEPVNDTLLRGELIGALAVLGDANIIAEVRRRASTTPPASIRNAVLGAYAYNANEADYADLLARARAARDFVEQRRSWLRLAAVKDETLARRTLDMTLGEEIPRQLRPQVLASVAGAHPRLAWDFLVAHRGEIEALLDPLQRMEYAMGIASASADLAMVAELQAYARDFPPGAEREVAGASATVMLRAQTIAERMPAVEAWIAARIR